MKWISINAILLAVLISTALGVVYVKHQNRMLFVQLRELQAQRDAMNVDWGRLQLEQSTWATHSRVENIARVKLSMHNLNYTDAVFIKP